MGVLDTIHWPTFAGAVAVAFVLFLIAMFIAGRNSYGYSG